MITKCSCLFGKCHLHYTLTAVAGLPFRPLGAEPTAYPPRPDAAERNEAARNLKSHHSVLNFVT